MRRRRSRTTCFASSRIASRRALSTRSSTTSFATGRLYACISSRPGQWGRCDGYILEGKELEFYTRQLAKKKSAKK